MPRKDILASNYEPFDDTKRDPLSSTLSSAEHYLPFHGMSGGNKCFLMIFQCSKQGAFPIFVDFLALTEGLDTEFWVYSCPFHFA